MPETSFLPTARALGCVFFLLLALASPARASAEGNTLDARQAQASASAMDGELAKKQAEALGNFRKAVEEKILSLLGHKKLPVEAESAENTVNREAAPGESTGLENAGKTADAESAEPSTQSAGAAEPSPRPARAELYASDKRLNLYVAGKPEIWAPLKADLISEGLDPKRLDQIFSAIANDYSPSFMALKAIELYTLSYGGYPGLKTPPKNEYCFVAPQTNCIAGGLGIGSVRKFIKNNAQLFAEIEKNYGVPASVVTGILMVETGIGDNFGSQSALRVLASMAVTDSLKAVLPSINGMKLSADQAARLDARINEKSDWARNELVALIKHADASNADILAMPGSVYGAIGLCQFMPSNIDAYGVDADGDGIVNLFTLPDAAHSIGRYLSANGWRGAQTPPAKVAVIRTYNHSDQYAYMVYAISSQIDSPKCASFSYGSSRGRVYVDPYLMARNRAAKRGVASRKFMGGSKAGSIGALPGYGDLLK